MASADRRYGTIFGPGNWNGGLDPNATFVDICEDRPVGTMESRVPAKYR
jgi:hypothetical protein